MAQTQAVVPVTVPFVGCRSGGQLGPIAAPKSSDKSITVPPNVAKRLAYYKAKWSPGILAPLGWNCLGINDHDSFTLLVTAKSPKNNKSKAKSIPERIASLTHLFSHRKSDITGPAILVSEYYGTTEGKLKVASFVARLFPEHKTFVQALIKQGTIAEKDLSYVPYPNDTLTYRGDRIVEYQTAPNSRGLGTEGLLKMEDSVIQGVAILTGETPDLVFLAMRLPADMDDLAPVIIQQTERDNAEKPR